MNSLLFDRADGYLHSQIRDTRTPFEGRATAAPFVTISREAGSGGSSLAVLLARKLNAAASHDVTWRTFEGAITARMLDSNHLPRSVARFLPEDRVPEVSSTIGELVGLHPSLWELTRKTSEEMRRLATAGHVILVGRGANFATADLPHGLHLRLVASPAYRARFLARRYNIPETQAATLNARCDAARRRYVRTVFGADVDDPSSFDLTINTERLSLPAAADLVVGRLAALAED